MDRGSVKGRVIERRRADRRHEVVSIEGEQRYCRTPCPQCPWRKDAPIGEFPAEAFRISAVTAHDMSTRKFGCHMSGTDRVATCAGFLISGADHNLAVRLGRATGELPFDLESPVELYANYREMAEANGVAPNDPALADCRDD